MQEKKLEEVFQEDLENDTIIEITELESDSSSESSQLIPKKEIIPISIAQNQGLYDLNQLLQMDGQFHFYTAATPFEFAIQEALKQQPGSPFLSIATLGGQTIQTTVNVGSVIARRLGLEKISNFVHDISQSKLPLVFSALGTSTKLWFVFKPMFKHTPPIVQAVAVPSASMALSFGALFFLPKLIQCFLEKSPQHNRKKAISKVEIAGQAICGFIAHDSNVVGIMNLLKLQEQTIFPFMQRVSNAQMIYIPALFGLVGIADKLCHTSKSPLAHKVSDYFLNPVSYMGQEILQSVYLWFQIEAMIAAKNKKISTTTFWVVTGVCSTMGLLKVGVSLFNYFKNVIPSKQSERQQFYPDILQEMNNVIDGWPVAELNEDLKEKNNTENIIEIHEMKQEDTIKVLPRNHFENNIIEIFDDSEEENNEIKDPLSMDEMYNNCSSALVNLSIFSQPIERFSQMARSYSSDCTIL
ncbi:MAG: hypothetical protein HYX60_00840 [Legionella longbeachae]|nr:hypothetical protein [Legionella longbeachae]